jgi:hypothetical protein
MEYEYRYRDYDPQWWPYEPPVPPLLTTWPMWFAWILRGDGWEYAEQHNGRAGHDGASHALPLQHHFNAATGLRVSTARNVQRCGGETRYSLGNFAPRTYLFPIGHSLGLPEPGAFALLPSIRHYRGLDCSPPFTSPRVHPRRAAARKG